MENSVLSHILSELGESGEKIANIGICYLLNEYPAAREALKSVLNMDTIPVCYEREKSIESGGRPDIVGKNADNKSAVFIEGKFWAHLTDKQPNAYLKDLDKEGRLLFLAPEQRKKFLKLQLKERIGGEGEERCTVLSWDEFLECIQHENNRNQDTNLTSDLDQLRTFCRKGEVEGMQPLSSHDLDPIHGKRAMHLSNVIYTCSEKLEELGYESKTKNTQHKYGTYFEIYSRDFGCDLYVGNDEWFRHKSRTPTPIWLSLYAKNEGGPSNEKIGNALKKFYPQHAHGHLLGIMLEAGMDEEKVVERIVKRVEETLNCLKNFFR